MFCLNWKLILTYTSFFVRCAEQAELFFNSNDVKRREKISAMLLLQFGQEAKQTHERINIHGPNICLCFSQGKERVEWLPELKSFPYLVSGCIMKKFCVPKKIARAPPTFRKCLLRRKKYLQENMYNHTQHFRGGFRDILDIRIGWFESGLWAYLVRKWSVSVKRPTLDTR